jgi:hypothetical protein
MQKRDIVPFNELISFICFLGNKLSNQCYKDLNNFANKSVFV